ncbi:putative HD superfamily hydrolase involved in NAD metabolism [Enterococcus sp. PF1-24]|uniref:bis(5'-nucleosyl)-tetraphosphatase (symmetrical) YqeK n=1 Tax=unclassified Enterococcus TaxID=2608891 RepID=UPI002473558F|nr:MULTISPECIES: bis(5'-nucleosyl)-tetraphosphatase (symmetrical) YqeK [unclassified Enterococcus]MDH6363219.1 putative HD superfamily hydrolase involved in NAD metabolism [Enterococcus sp. PFB1-1]MDH6400480.1 putative HD superfamily hydrolase involved in NAD metabolism [Enterococcus sp. PF1-24]
MLVDYKIDFSTSILEEQVAEYLHFFKKEKIYQHSLEVAKEAEKLARKFGESEESAYLAGLFHDVSGVIPNEKRIQFHEALNLEIYPAERQLPMILHQRQSAILTTEIFNLTISEVNSAIACHTTLKKQATQLDKIVFIADKIRWDREGQPLYLTDLLASLTESLDKDCLYYIEWLLANDIIVVHPWLIEAKQDLEKQIALS